MNKKLLIIFAIIVVVVTVAFVLFGGRSGSTLGPAPSPTLAPPAPTSIFIQPANVTFSFVSPPTIPSSLPTYTFQAAVLSTIERAAASAALTLNLSATPSAITRGGSYTKTWSRPNEASLRVSQTNDITSITFQQSKTDERPGALAPDVAAQQFLLALVPPTASLSVRASGTSAGPFDGLLVLDTPTPVQYINYFYSYVVAAYPILTSDLSITPVSIIVDSGGTIRSASIAPPPSSLQSGNSIALLNRDQILASLAAGRGTLLDTHSPQSPNQGAVPNFSKFTVKTSQIVYAPQGGLLLPALYMTGTGTATGGGAQDATIFLWLSPEGAAVQP